MLVGRVAVSVRGRARALASRHLVGRVSCHLDGKTGVLYSSSVLPVRRSSERSCNYGPSIVLWTSGVTHLQVSKAAAGFTTYQADTSSTKCTRTPPCSPVGRYSIDVLALQQTGGTRWLSVAKLQASRQRSHTFEVRYTGDCCSPEK